MAEQYLFPFPLYTASQAVRVDTWFVDTHRCRIEPVMELDAGDQVFGTADGRLFAVYRGGPLSATYELDAERTTLRRKDG